MRWAEHVKSMSAMVQILTYFTGKEIKLILRNRK